ncbi:ABC transporter ATP-binding protein/permease [Clostridium estertheticum]|uniref:ABC transporter ATP-binding protein/permease n=1 Tax=Clostridium estertheticum TaxID=238834 RepID=UPI001C6DE3B0|nr:ABC transporter ATP-binding protein/permease [Clostridium estertheticum]MBW9152980.1 ABC transporter ATP-binding protein/permease [Clostridium estertheticum]WLC82655.1 ABC transporter ATP-binding protein/permease [Clostridium estertheticum]
MLILKNIVKEYTAGNTRIKALKGINIDFRENELVSILGPPNCGKTTMLNIICGLDIYTSGNLSINGKSTKEFSNRDWDAFRNNSIGLMLQSYKLISHETVLENVEITMKLSGEAKFERRERAITVLKKVGICNKFNKKPNKMSYGEIKRVTIARALVNNPEVLLADEPTETLDLETSIKIMEILKEISRDKLVIMVTNDLEIAQKYSTRIIKLFDGNVIYDSNPYHVVVEKPTRNEKGGKTSMGLLTALSLSFNSLMSKKGKTFMTSFIASSGIIGIVLILLLSSGATTSSMKIRCKFIVFALTSLVVSLISISTSIYISVLGRTKEIGVLRSIGVSRKDIFLVFNAETLIIGFVSDVIGFCIIYVFGIFKLPATSWMVIVIISMVVHLMAGFIPSIIAANKDYFLDLKSG